MFLLIPLWVCEYYWEISSVDYWFLSEHLDSGQTSLNCVFHKFLKPFPKSFWIWHNSFPLLKLNLNLTPFHKRFWIWQHSFSFYLSCLVFTHQGAWRVSKLQIKVPTQSALIGIFLCNIFIGNFFCNDSDSDTILFIYLS